MVLPGGVAALAARAYGLLPESLASRALPSKLRYDPRTLPITEAPDTSVRALIAPTNFAGQGWQWARAMERSLTDVGAVAMSFAVGAGYGFAVDVSVPASAYVLSRSWRRRERAAVLGGFTHVFIESGRHPLGGVYEQRLDEQIRELRDAGVAVAFIGHGTDVRVPSAHAQREPDSPFGSRGGFVSFEGVEAQARANLQLIQRMKLPAFVSTPDLLDDVPGATWLPVVIEPERWRSSHSVLQADRPVVVHAPSDGPLKGSDLIDPVMSRLHDDGVVEYRRISGVPAADMPALLRQADIVLEQFRIGSYGVAACEALAAGRLVIGNVGPHVRARVAAYGRELPIVQSTAAGLRETILKIVEERAAFRELAATGPDFVRDIHAGDRAADAVRDFLGR